MSEVYSQFRDQGFSVLAVPCNQFGSQEPASNKEIEAFAKAKGAEFPIFAKSTTNKPHCKGSRPRCSTAATDCCLKNNGLYQTLISQLPGQLQWNFEKFLVGRDGKAIKRYSSGTDPRDIIPDIQKALTAPRPKEEL